MRIQWKVTLLVLLTLVGTLTAVVWKTRAVLVKDKIGFMADSSMKQIAPLKRLVQERLDDHKSRLVKFAAARSSSASAAAVKLPRTFGDYEVVALVQPQAGSPETTQWQPAWVEKSPAAKAEQWPQGFDLTLLKSLPYSRVKDGDTIWARVSDRQGAPVFAILISVEIQNPAASAQGAPAAAAVGEALPDNTDYKAQAAGFGKRAIVVGFLTADPMANVTEDYIGSTNTVYIVDERGYVASHVNKQYLGANFTEDPIVQDIVKEHKGAGSGNYEDLESRQVLGHFERVDRTNLFAIITAPLDAVNASVNSQLKVAWQTGAAVGLIGLILAWLMGRGVSGPIEEATEAIRALNRGEAASIPAVTANDEVGALLRLLAESSPTALKSKVGFGEDRKQEPSESGTSTMTESRVLAAEEVVSSRLAAERRAAYEVFNEGFSKAIKEPLMAILGHAQLTKSKTENLEIRAHAESVERETRRAQDVIDRLQAWADGNAEAKAAPQTDGLKKVSMMSVEEVVNEALGLAEADFMVEGINVTKDLHSVPRVAGSGELLKASIQQIFDNSREAMRARPEKNLRVQLDFLSDSVYLVIEDSGPGMAKDVKERAFEPFFKDFASPKRLGLGLALVQTTIKSLGGTAEIESVPGQSTTLTLKLPVRAEERKNFLEKSTSDLAKSTASRFSPTADEHPPANEPTTASGILDKALADAVTGSHTLTPPPLPPKATAPPTPPPASMANGKPRIDASVMGNLLNAAARPRGAGNTNPGVNIGALATPTSSQATPPPLPPPTLASHSIVDDDEDGDEMFANVPLGQMLGQVKKAEVPPPVDEPVETTVMDDEILTLGGAPISPLAPPINMPPPISMSPPPTGDGAPTSDFQVRIRRPRVRS